MTILKRLFLLPLWLVIWPAIDFYKELIINSDVNWQNKGELYMLKRIHLLSLLALATLTLGLSACETVEGAGRDIENGGEAIQRAAD